MLDLDKRILTISPAYKPPRGGMAQLVYNYDKYVFDTFYFLPSGKAERSFSSYAVALMLPFRMVCQFLRHPTIKIVHIHTCSGNTFRNACYIAKLSRLFGKKVLFHMHGGGFKEYFRNNNEFVSKHISLANGVVALSPSWKEFYANTIGAKNVWVVPNVVPVPKCNEPGRKDNLFHLVYLGHIRKSKGIFDLVEMINEHHEEYTGRLMLDIGGGMYEEDQLKKYVCENQLHDVINVKGWIVGDEKDRMLSDADVFILPSYVETQPLSIIEAMSYKLPILSTKVGGIPELVEDGVNGFLFEPGDKDAMKSYIDKLMTDTETKEALAMQSEIRSLEYLPDSVRDTLHKLYSSLC